MNITYVAEDFLESQILEELAEKASQMRLSFLQHVILGNGVKPSPNSPETIRAAVADADIVVVATSSCTVAEVIAAEEAVKLHRPLILVALGHRAWQNPDFAGVRNATRTLFVSDKEQATAAAHLFLNARIIPTGIPTYETFAFPKYTREEVREKLGIASDHKFILVPGDKDFTLNIPLAVCVLEALRTLPNPWSYEVILTIHPGHTPFPRQESSDELLAFYQSQFDCYNSKVHIRVSCKATPFGIGTPDMVPGADLVIGINSTVLIRAAYLRIPAIAMLLAGAFSYELPHENDGWWPPVDTGAIEGIYNMSSGALREDIRELCNPRSGTSLMRRHFQEVAYPAPQRVGSAYEKMIADLESFE